MARPQHSASPAKKTAPPTTAEAKGKATAKPITTNDVEMADLPSTQQHTKKNKNKASGARWSVKALPWDTLVEGKMTDLPVVFTRDADYFFLVSKTTIKIYSRTTGQVVSTLSSDRLAHTATITGIMIDPSNPLQLITSSLDGHIKVWDFLDGVLLKSFDVGFPITALAAHQRFKGIVFVAVKKPRHESDADQNDAPKKKKRSSKKAAEALQDDNDSSSKYNSIIYTVSLSVPQVAGASGAQANFSSGASVKPELMRIGKTREAASLGISPNGRWLVVIGNRKVQVAQTSNLRAGFTKFVTAPQGGGSETGDRLTCMAFHPTEEGRLVTGDDRGRIRIWYCLDEKYMVDVSSQDAAGLAMERHAPSTVLHWHAHAVASLAFTPNGAHLLSGGEEGVLVVWQLAASGGNGASKEFVPRLGAPISTIAVANGLDGREQEFAVGLADGTVTFVGSMNLKPTRTFSRIKIDPSRHLVSSSQGASNSAARKAATAAKAHGLPLAVHPSTGNLVLPSGHSSSIQFYDAEKDVNAMELEVAPSNRVSRADDDPIEPTRVEKVVFSTSVSNKTGESGEWMVTFDSRNLVDDALDEEQGEGSGSDGSVQLRTRVISESSLKFWRWDMTNRRYVLNTRIDRPHSGKRLTSITFSPSSEGYLLVTTGRDGRIRSWSLTSRRLKSGRTESYWTCRSCFQYRDTVPMCSSFSPDGSLLAVGQGSFVTFWQPEANLLQMTLSCPELRHRIKQVKFVGANGRWVVVASTRTVVMWDLVMGKVCWRRDALGSGPLQSQVASWSSAGDADEAGTAPVGARSSILSILDHDKDASKFCIVLNRARENRTLVEVYAVPSSTLAPSLSSRPVERYTIDRLKLRQVISSPLGTAKPGAPSFIGLSQGYDLLRLGKSALLGTSAGSSSIRGISGARKTLFDDLFGPTLLADAAEDEDEVDVDATQATEREKKGVEALFDVPSHLLPPVTSLLDAFVERLLPPRIAVADKPTDKATAQNLGSRQQQQDDEEGEADEKRQLEQRDAQKEVQDVLVQDVGYLVDMFRGLVTGATTDASTSPQKPSKAKPNGTPNAAKESGKKRKA
ncbi:NET1-associated nuclear protein 1 [Thecaphora frezii]